MKVVRWKACRRIDRTRTRAVKDEALRRRFARTMKLMREVR